MKATEFFIDTLLNNNMYEISNIRIMDFTCKFSTLILSLTLQHEKTFKFIL